jgi:hypothetical protein
MPHYWTFYVEEERVKGRRDRKEGKKSIYYDKI